MAMQKSYIAKSAASLYCIWGLPMLTDHLHFCHKYLCFLWKILLCHALISCGRRNSSSCQRIRPGSWELGSHILLGFCARLAELEM